MHEVGHDIAGVTQAESSLLGELLPTTVRSEVFVSVEVGFAGVLIDARLNSSETAPTKEKGLRPKVPEVGLEKKDLSILGQDAGAK